MTRSLLSFLRCLFTRRIFLCIFQLVFFAAGLPSDGFSQNAKFSYVDSEKGLSQASVRCILQDSRGYMWFGTADGLNRYDGYQMKVFRNNPSDTNSLSDNNIECLFEDGNGVIWVGTHGGLNAYHAFQNRFVRFQNDHTKPNSISGDLVRCIHEDKQGIYWVGTPYGLNSFDGKHNSFKKYERSGDNDTLSLEGFRVEAIHEDKKGRLWVCTSDGGLNLLNREKETFVCYKDLRPGPHSEYFNRMKSLAEDESGALWIATDEAGVVAFNPETKKFLQRYLNNPDGAAASLSGDRASSLYFDRQNRLWIGTKTAGLCCLDRKTGKFFTYRYNEYDPQSISSDDVDCLYADREGNLWIGTEDGGASVWFPNSAKFRHYHRDITNEHAFLSNTIMAILQSKDGAVWLGTKGGGITVMNRTDNAFVNYGQETQFPHLVAYNNGVLSLYEDPEGLIWVGTWGQGVNVFNRKTGKIDDVLGSGAITCLVPGRNGTLWIGCYGRSQGVYACARPANVLREYTKKDGLSSDNVYCIFPEERQVWIGTEDGGLNRLDPVSGKVKVYRHQNGKNSISDNQVNCIFDDHKGNLWIGTSIGLNKFNRKSETFTAYYETDGLPSNYVCGILGDKTGNLWISTNNGISRFAPDAENKEGSAFRNFSEHDGLQGAEFNVGASFQNKSTGEMFFGGINGFNSFYPDNIAQNKHIPPVYITSFKKFGKEPVLDSAISSKKSLTLSYKDNFISFEFVALDYVFPEKNRYSFTMEGLDNGWSPPSSRRYVSYTNLPGGEYTFRVKACNSDGVWNEEGTAIHITVIPPWWKTNAFYASCILLSLASVFGFVRFRTAAIEREKKILEQKVTERTIELAQKNHDITSSIQYAKRIQDAILPTREMIQRHFPQSFVLFRPKDIVSGDFYWFGEKNGKKIAACVDCTGHGVPGAFMSMIGTNLLNQIILEDGVTQPAAILDALNRGVRSALKQGGQAEIQTSDGMDIALCAIDAAKREVQFSSALRSLVVVGNQQMEKIDGNKFPIGGAQLEAERIFTNHSKILAENETMYMFSDGYADQFGGPKGKKLMVKRLQEILVTVSTLPMQEQKAFLELELDNWKGSQAQVDDILVIGIRI